MLAGGGEVHTPFGVFYAPNLTPDAATGIGKWTLEDFRRAMRHGVAPGGRLLYPAFPYEQYTFMRDDDVEAIYGYLQSLPPLARAANAHQLRFPFGTQTALAAWRGLYFYAAGENGTSAGLASAPSSDTPDALGRYLVQAVTHCAACHSPRNGLGALGGGQRLDGGWMAVEGWQAPSLQDSREAGVQHWQASEVVQLLRTGRTDAGATASGPMADAVFWSTQYLSEADASAIAVYLQHLPDAAPERAGAVGAPEKGASEARESKVSVLYQQQCASCHGKQGEGVALAFPALAGNRAVLRADPANMLRSILQGGYAPAVAGQSPPHGMPPFLQALSDADIAALATYIRQSWGNAAPAVATIDAFRARQGQP